MSIPTNAAGLSRPRAVSAIVDATSLRVTIADGREVSAPMSWFDWLAGATDDQRRDVRRQPGPAALWVEVADPRQQQAAVVHDLRRAER
jgi:hypothetical protein